MQTLALLLIGFSLFTAVILILGDILENLEFQPYPSRIAGFVLIICLASIQWLNLQAILDPAILVYSSLYIALLYCIAPSFYFYSRWLLIAELKLESWQLSHLAPLIIGLLIPFNWAVPLAFLIGSGYLLWLGKAVYLLRSQRSRFKLELIALALFFSIAISVVGLGFIWTIIDKSTFLIGYSILIGLAFCATTLTLLKFPSITTEIAETSQATYAESTLKNIDREKIIQQLNQKMQQEKLYTLETLSLAMLAEQLQLSSHQLSELINTEFYLGFSKYIRKYRIEAAKKLLLAEPKSSVLSIGLSVGFNTQSNFYTAFRDIEGMAPGQYRKQFNTIR